MEYKKLVNQHGIASGWVGETESRPQTAGSTLAELKFPVMEVYAMPAASQGLLDDSFTDIAAWLAGEVQLEFAQKEGTAFISGDGINKPMGFLSAYPIVTDASYAWGKIGYVPTGAAGAFLTSGTPRRGADRSCCYHTINTAYRSTASTFLANRKTLGAIRKLKDGQGNYLLNMVLQPEGFIEEILGRPAVEMPDMPDIAANSLLGCLRRLEARLPDHRSRRHPRAPRSLHRKALRAVLHDEARRRRRAELRSLKLLKFAGAPPMRDLHNHISAVRVLSPVAVGTTGVGKTGKILDRQLYEAVELLFDYGTVTATNAVITPVVKECATTGGSFTSVADADMLPQVGAEAAAALGQAATRTSGVSKNVTKRLGYIGNKRYLQVSISSTVTAAPPVAITAVLGNPASGPVA
jgi:hypothetical protein